MKLQSWTITYETGTDRKINDLRFTSLGYTAKECLIVFKKNMCIILIKTDAFQFEKSKFVIKSCLEVEGNAIANILSFNYTIPLRKPVIIRGNPKRIKSDTIAIHSNIDYRGFYLKKYSERNSQILEAYREILNEPSPALNFIMGYRLIEMISKESRATAEALILNLVPNIYLVPDKRNPKKKNSVITHYRNSIHATTNKYCFPYGGLAQYSDQMSKCLFILVDKAIS